jgi:hypothetical protein
MTPREIATTLVAYCRKSEWMKALQELYADDAISIEPYETPDFAKETKGKENMLAKARKFTGMTREVHSVELSEPLLAGNAFALRLDMDITTTNGRTKMSELCVYETRDGKIISEQFFF